jgi:ornithine cyclodeaminase/alanine dehydrogenase-like protein (mu-crystallin family)
LPGADVVFAATSHSKHLLQDNQVHFVVHGCACPAHQLKHPCDVTRAVDVVVVSPPHAEQRRHDAHVHFVSQGSFCPGHHGKQLPEASESLNDTGMQIAGLLIRPALSFPLAGIASIAECLTIAGLM